MPNVPNRAVNSKVGLHSSSTFRSIGSLCAFFRSSFLYASQPYNSLIVCHPALALRHIEQWIAVASYNDNFLSPFFCAHWHQPKNVLRDLHVYFEILSVPLTRHRYLFRYAQYSHIHEGLPRLSRLIYGHFLFSLLGSLSTSFFGHTISNRTWVTHTHTRADTDALHLEDDSAVNDQTESTVPIRY